MLRPILLLIACVVVTFLSVAGLFSMTRSAAAANPNFRLIDYQRCITVHGPPLVHRRKVNGRPPLADLV